MRIKVSSLVTTAVFCLVLAALVAGCTKNKDLWGANITWLGSNGGALSGEIKAKAAIFPSTTTDVIMNPFDSTDIATRWMEWTSLWANGAVSEAGIWYNSTKGQGPQAGDLGDGMGYLHIQAGGYGQPFRSWTTGGVEWQDDWRIIAFPAQHLMGLDVSRKFYANPNADYVNKEFFGRWLEILTNNSPSPITVNVVIGSNMGSDHATMVVATKDGDLVVDPAVDNWFITGDLGSTTTGTTNPPTSTGPAFRSMPRAAATVSPGPGPVSYITGSFNDPIAGHLLDGTSGVDKIGNIFVNTSSTFSAMFDYEATSGYTTSPYTISSMSTSAHRDDLLYTWAGVTVEPGKTKIIMHMEVMTLGNNLNPAWSAGVPDAIATEGVLEVVPPEVLGAMTADEINAVVNFPAARNNCNVWGGANSVEARKIVTVNNMTQGTSAQGYGMPNGSFGVCINANVGDQLEVKTGSMIFNVIAE